MPIFNGVRVKVGYSKMPHGEYALFVAGVYESLLDNRHFRNPPVDLSVLKELLDEYRKLIVAADDGSRTAMLKRNSIRRQLEQLVSHIGHYVEWSSNDDPAVFATSGFERLPNTRASAEPLMPAGILKILHGHTTGSVRVRLSPALRKVRFYELRYGIHDSASGSWRTEVFTSANGPVTVRNLEPGTRYVFQVRAFGGLGFTDWSDPVSFICT